jgi:hypothetical protein
MAKESTKTTVRTVLQTLVGVAVALPGIVAASGVPAALPWVAGALAVAAGVARVLALASVQALLPAWLRTDGGGAGARE